MHEANIPVVIPGCLLLVFILIELELFLLLYL